MTTKPHSLSGASVPFAGANGNTTRVYLAWLVLLLLQSFGAPAQTIMSPLEWVVSDKDKRETLSDYLQIPQAQAGAFWKIYEDYERHRRDLFRERLKLINKYAEARSTAASEKKVLGIARRLLINDVEYKEMYKSYYRRIALIIGAHKALQFISIEEQFQLRTNARLERVLLPQNYLIASKGDQTE